MHRLGCGDGAFSALLKDYVLSGNAKERSLPSMVLVQEASECVLDVFIRVDGYPPLFDQF